MKVADGNLSVWANASDDMSHWTISKCRSRVTARWLVTLFLFGWFGLILQPCSAAAASACLNCPSHQTQDLCGSLPGNPCVTGNGVAAKPWAGSGGCDTALAPPALLALVPVSLGEPIADHVHSKSPPILAGGDGPPLNIRFCTYSK